MLVMLGDQPHWCCDICGYPVKSGHVLYGVEGMRGHFPAAHVVCGDACAVICEDRLTAKPVKRLAWATFLDALHR
jgi:predicted nucleic acid-binding Zn ribbon protein